jgi:hypothetical protein
MSKITINDQHIQHKIFSLRSQQVMLDRDLAELYQVETRALKQAVKRNIDRFPEDFMFELTEDEINFMVSQNVIPSKKHLGGAKPYAFTEQGVSMLSSVLKSKIAINVNIAIFRAFAKMRKFLLANAMIFQKLNYIEQKLLQHDENFEKVFNAIESKDVKPKQGIFYDGQIFDAYVFVTNLIRSAEKSIVLIDNYIDETILTLFRKNQKIEVTIFTKNISKQLKLDVKKYNVQYKPISINRFNASHDRFLIIDDNEVYHFGASLKDLGKKWFAFSKFDMKAVEILNKLKKQT